MTIPRLIRCTGVLLLVLGPSARPAGAQLISPGELSEAHSELEGIRSCTSCHQLRSKGIDEGLCLDCHEPLNERIEAGEGFHVASNATRDCARCHKEHFGREFELVRWEPSEFDHAEVGWAPEGAHASLDCRECHTSRNVQAGAVRTFKGSHGSLSRTYLGLDTECLTCHRDENPHGDQFAGQTCDSCHGQDRWEDPAGFDHDRTRYRLTGLHRRVECAGCHPPQEDRAPGTGGVRTAANRASTATADLRFTGLAFRECTSCHRDEHDGGMGATCSACHTTAGWYRVAEEALRGRFDHDIRFPLEGAHAEAACETCHGRPARDTGTVRIRYLPGMEGRAYPSPAADGCASCHLDEHSGEFSGWPGRGACDGCHDQEAWYPAGFDVRRHNEESRFRLEGAHVAIPCITCHPDPETATTTSRFRVGLPGTCVDCHADDDPHGDQFPGQACDACHDNRTYSIDRFDHERTRYQLDGAHRGVGCAECHPSEPVPGGGQMTRFTPLASECTDCHGGGA